MRAHGVSGAAVLVAFGLVLAAASGGTEPGEPASAQAEAAGLPETKAQRDARLAWWRAARFGLFIHWGLYAIPAGEWGGQTGHGEWIRHTAQIPVSEYEQLAAQFNPVKFDARRWVQLAKTAGMKYIVITSKHHDGFCLFDSQYTDYDVMSTPFGRDILKELAEACRAEGLRICWYHSIMDWHHPDYLPRRPWEQRSAEGANFDRYYAHLKNQLRELITNYGPIGILWFDGEWESTWTHEYGEPLYRYVRSLQPDIIINNRVDKGRGGMAGLTSGDHVGDYGTPEQEIPATGLPGVDWETCMTMNDHWGYNRHDHNYKSTRDLIRMLVDIASKGGNYLLNVGPTAEGEFPAESVQRLEEIGRWMQVNGESIYETQASPFKTLAWGRCTHKPLDGGNTRLYLHVFDWPADGRLVVPGLLNEPLAAHLLVHVQTQSGVRQVNTTRAGDALVVRVPEQAPDAIDTVVVLDIAGRADVTAPPVISAAAEIFVDTLEIAITSDRERVELRYTLDGSEPTATAPAPKGPITLRDSTTVTARAFRADRAVSPAVQATFTKVTPRPAEKAEPRAAGLQYAYYEGDWDRLPEFAALTPVRSGVVAGVEFPPECRREFLALRFTGFVDIPRAGVYTFETISDDGSRLYIGDALIVDNDGLHGTAGKSGVAALAAGPHPLTVTYFNKTGGRELEAWFAGPGLERSRLPAAALTHASGPAPSRPAAGPIVPSPRQVAWQELELIAFVHFGMNTFTDREWGEGTEDPQLFNPTQLDAGQWVRALKAAGFRQVIVTAKHHDGFCLWPSAYTEHSVKNSPWRGGQGDVVRELADACRAAGLKLGVYLSPWDRHEPTYGDSPRYNEHYCNQLTELLTRYGPVHEVWFDGACGEGPNGKRQVYDWPAYIATVRRLAPQAVIFSDAGPDVRWVGNERGVAGETNWSLLRRDEFYPGTPNSAPLTTGQADGTHWVPAECDVSIRPGWFYHAAEDEKVKTAAELVDIYYQSVGRNGVLLLNVPPDRRGLIHETDAARLAAFRAVLDETFRTNLAAGAAVSAAGGEEAGGGPARVLDGDPVTYWTARGGTLPVVLTLDLGRAVRFDRALLMEAIRLGQRIRAFSLEAGDGRDWRPIARGTTVGYKRLLRFPAVEATHVRLIIQDAAGNPAVSEVGLYQASPRETAAIQ